MIFLKEQSRLICLEEHLCNVGLHLFSFSLSSIALEVGYFKFSDI